jgi:hypothetical protein
MHPMRASGHGRGRDRAAGRVVSVVCSSHLVTVCEVDVDEWVRRESVGAVELNKPSAYHYNKFDLGSYFGSTKAVQTSGSVQKHALTKADKKV